MPIHFKIHPKFSLVLLVVGTLVGLFLSAQWRSKPTRITSSLLPYTSLKESRDILQIENENLKKQISILQEQITSDQKLLKEEKITSTSILEELKKVKEKVALAPQEGEGVIITLADSQKKPATTDSIVHAADLRDLINFLWANEVKAMAINNERVSQNTSIDCIVNTILINNARLNSPFYIQVIGDAKRLEEALLNENNLLDLYRRKKQGLIFGVSTSKNITLPGYDGSYTLEFAKISE